MDVPAHLACRPDLGEARVSRGTPRVRVHMLLSFERPAASGASRSDGGITRGFGASRRTLKTAQLAKSKLGITGPDLRVRPDHRQDNKGTRWMPWHQESMKGVDGCDKPRLGAEWPLTRGFPNGETQRW